MGARRVSVVLALVAVVVGVAVLMLLRARRGGEPEPERPRYTGRTLPSFSLADLSGRTWTNDDLAGKTAFVNVWATWCAPCREEMPHLQELYERVKSRPDVVLLTLNVDEKPELVAPFVAKHAYTFPVLLAHGFVREELKVVGIPRNWVLTPDGVWREDHVGLPDTGGRTWVEWASSLIDPPQPPR